MFKKEQSPNNKQNIANFIMKIYSILEAIINLYK